MEVASVIAPKSRPDTAAISAAMRRYRADPDRAKALETALTTTGVSQSQKVLAELQAAAPSDAMRRSIEAEVERRALRGRATPSAGGGPASGGPGGGGGALSGDARTTLLQGPPTDPGSGPPPSPTQPAPTQGTIKYAPYDPSTHGVVSRQHVDQYLGEIRGDVLGSLAPIAVGTEIADRPPHRSRRALSRGPVFAAITMANSRADGQCLDGVRRIRDVARHVTPWHAHVPRRRRALYRYPR